MAVLEHKIHLWGNGPNKTRSGRNCKCVLFCRAEVNKSVGPIFCFRLTFANVNVCGGAGLVASGPNHCKAYEGGFCFFNALYHFVHHLKWYVDSYIGGMRFQTPFLSLSFSYWLIFCPLCWSSSSCVSHSLFELCVVSSLSKPSWLKEGWVVLVLSV